MGTYLFAARAPKYARIVEVEWDDDHSKQVVPVLGLAYLYKPSMWSDCERAVRPRESVFNKIEQAWAGVIRPKYAVEVNTLARKRGVIRVGDKVMVWTKDEAPVFVRDDPDWGGCIRYGNVVRIVSPLPMLPRPLTCCECGDEIYIGPYRAPGSPVQQEGVIFSKADNSIECRLARFGYHRVINKAA